MSALDWVNVHLLPHPEDENYDQAIQKYPLSYHPRTTSSSSTSSTSSESSSTSSRRSASSTPSALATIDESTPLVAHQGESDATCSIAYHFMHGSLLTGLCRIKPQVVEGQDEEQAHFEEPLILHGLIYCHRGIYIQALGCAKSKREYSCSWLLHLYINLDCVFLKTNCSYIYFYNAKCYS